MTWFSFSTFTPIGPISGSRYMRDYARLKLIEDWTQEYYSNDGWQLTVIASDWWILWKPDTVLNGETSEIERDLCAFGPFGGVPQLLSSSSAYMTWNRCTVWFKHGGPILTITLISLPDLALSRTSSRFSAKNYSMNNLINVTRVKCCTTVCCKTCYVAVVM